MIPLKVKDYIGKRFGFMVITKYNGKYSDGSLQFTCKCDCGKVFVSTMRKDNEIRTSCYDCNCKRIGRMNTKIFVECDGKEYTIRELADKVGIRRVSMEYRIKKWDKSRWKEPKKEIMKNE